MKLKCVELENFKTFAGRIRIPFAGNFTGITGPNGSGKSNILDAILFVLGPRSSKTMRVENLSKLIFNGGKNGNPAKYCRVTLVFDNTSREFPVDLDEITFTKAVRVKSYNYYSYYYLNGKGSSMSEFEDFFTSSGINGNYNIVQQGDVNCVVTASSFERRRIIDNVAGVSKFDEDMERAEKIKNEVENNIQILEARLEEVDTQLKTLESDRNKTLKYLELKDDLQFTKAKLAYKQLASCRERKNETAQRLKEYDEENRELNEKLSRMEGELEVKTRKIGELVAEIEEKLGKEGKKVQESINSFSVKAKSCEEKVSFYKDQTRSNGEALKELSREIEREEQNFEEISKDKTTLETEVERWNDEIEEKRAKLQEIRESIRNTNATIETLEEEITTLNKEKKELSERKHGNNMALEELNARLENERRELNLHREDRGNIEQELREIRKSRKEREKRLKELSNKIIENNKKLSELNGRSDELRNDLKNVRRVLEKLNSDYSKARGSANRAVSAVLSARNLGKLRGIIGTIGEKVKPRREGYEIALRVAGGHRLSALITRNDENAAKAIEYLKKGNYGRAEFLPLNKLFAPKPGGKALLAVKDPAAIGFASDLIEYDESIKNAVEYVFGRTVVVKDLTNARRLMGGVRLVTLSGELIEPSGAMIGGSIAKIEKGAESIGREMDEKSAKCESIALKLSDLEDLIRNTELESKKAMDEKQFIEELTGNEPFEKLEKSLVEIKQKEKEKDSSVRQIGTGIKKLTDENSSVEAEIERMDEELKKASQSLSTATPKNVRKSMEALEKGIEDIDGLVQELNRKITEVTRDYEAKNALIGQKRTEKKRIEEEIEKYGAEIERAEGEKRESEDELQALIKVKSEYDEKVSSLSKKKDRVNGEINELRIAIGKTRDRIDTNEDLKYRYLDEMKKLDELIAECREEIERTGIADKQEMIESEIVNVTVEGLRERIKWVESKIEHLEPVNQKALEEYDQATARANEIDSDRSRLDQQRTSLTEVMEECKKKKLEAFFSIFNSINENFRKVYRRLSNGGNGKLVLDNKKDPFAGGLKIVAQPPEKKPQPINSLSGGEKSVAALALIFAIQKISFSPFYVLDEVDMFLDSLNAEIVGKMIKENAMNTQTMVISLRKVTLKNADAVFGVASVDGISQIVGKINVQEVVEVINA